MLNKPSILLVETEKGWSTTLGMKKSQGKWSTAVRNFGQWPYGWTGDLEEWLPPPLNRGQWRELIDFSNKILYTYWLWRYVHLVLTNCVPAVAAIRKRLVLFILNRFKGYLDGRICPKGNNFARVWYKKRLL